MNNSVLSKKYNAPEVFIRRLHTAIKQIYPKFDKKYIEDCLKSILKPSVFNKKSDDCLTGVDFVLPKKCKYVDLYKNYGKIGTWSFGRHSKGKNEVLMGCVKVLNQFGVIVLSDEYYSMACVIVPTNSMKISSFIDKCIIVKNYTVFTEVFNFPNTMNCEYLYIRASDIEIVNVNGDSLVQNPCNSGEELKKLICHIIRKSVVCLSQRNEPEIWFEIQVINTPQSPTNELLCLGSNLIQVGMSLHIGKEYALFYFIPRERYVNYEIKKFRPNLPSWKINDPSLYFRRIKVNLHFDKVVVLSTNEAVANVRNKNFGTVISFAGLLSCRKLVPALSSRTATSNNFVGFGTSGSKTHVLEFTGLDKQILVLYLNNWERKQVPLGLVPGMSVLVRDVAVQSDRYYKSTAFTRFEILKDNTLANFDTVNLYTEEKSENIKYTYLGLGDRLPPDIIVWAKISYIEIRSLRLIISCLSCLTDYCYCNKNDAEIIVKLTCSVRDGFGESFLIANDLELLRLIFNISTYSWKKWCRGIRSYGSYTFIRDSHPKLTGNHKRDKVGKYLYMLIKCTNFNRMRNYSIEVKCRKMIKNNNPEYANMPTFYCLEARSTSAKL